MTFLNNHGQGFFVVDRKDYFLVDKATSEISSVKF